MSITNHSLWPQLQPFFYAEADENTSMRKPRIRIEVKPLPQSLEPLAADAVMPCVACGKDIHPIRFRAAKSKRGTSVGRMYYAPCCPLEANIGCSRGGAARREYEHMRTVLP